MNETAKRLLALLETRRGEYSPNNPELDKYQHSLQCAHLAAEAGESADYVVAALFHDVFGGFSAEYHGVMVGMVLAPWLSERALKAITQHVPAMAELRDPTLDYHDAMGVKISEGYPEAVEFAARYDMPAFNPQRAIPPINVFYPLIERVMPSTVDEPTLTRYVQ